MAHIKKKENACKENSLMHISFAFKKMIAHKKKKIKQ